MKEPNEVLKVIDSILTITDEDYSSKGLIDGEAYITYLNGKCYYFAYILEQLLGCGDYMINNERNHIALKVGNYIYDASGIADSHDFSLVEGEDLVLIENLLMGDKGEKEFNKTLSTNIINKVKNLNKDQNKEKTL